MQSIEEDTLCTGLSFVRDTKQVRFLRQAIHQKAFALACSSEDRYEVDGFITQRAKDCSVHGIIDLENGPTRCLRG